MEKVHGALRIREIDVHAARSGLKRGQALADARACLPNIAVAEADALADAEFIGRLADLCDRFSPMVARDPPDGLLLDITGCAHLFGTEADLRAQLLARLQGLGLHVRASIAGTPDAARALARFSQVAIAPPRQDEALIRYLPVAAITGISNETALALLRAGLKTIGALADRPTTVLAARFGEDLVTRLMRTLGRENVRITPLRSLPSVMAERQFAEPMLQAEALEGILEMLIGDVAHIMNGRGEGGRIFEASFFFGNGAVRRLTVETGRPLRDVGAILGLYHERLQSLAEPMDPGFGFDAIRLIVPLTEPLGVAQIELHGRAPVDHDVADLIDRLSVRFGCDRVLRFEARDTHSPDRASRLVPAANGGPAAVAWQEPETDEPPLRPLHLFDPPRLIEALAEVPDGPPLRFRWRRVLHDVAHVEGPERIAPEWWCTPSAMLPRDYYRVEDDKGRRFWIFREGLYGDTATGPRWFLHGVFA